MSPGPDGDSRAPDRFWHHQRIGCTGQQVEQIDESGHRQSDRAGGHRQASVRPFSDGRHRSACRAGVILAAVRDP